MLTRFVTTLYNPPKQPVKGTKPQVGFRPTQPDQLLGKTTEP